MTARIEFDETPYLRSHGHMPKGRGSWAIGTEAKPDCLNEHTCWFSPGGLTLTEAKKWAKAKARDLFGADAEGTLYILP